MEELLPCLSTAIKHYVFLVDIEFKKVEFWVVKLVYIIYVEIVCHITLLIVEVASVRYP